MEGERQVQTTIKYAEEELSDELIEGYIDRFEELLNDHNIEQMRDFIRAFIFKIELWARVKGKIRGRKVHIHGQIPALTGIAMASPMGRVRYPCEW